MKAMKSVVGSANPVKIAAVRDVFEPYFPGAVVEGIETPSGVPAQPVGEDTFTGAENRARTLLIHNADRSLGAAFCVGLEGGIAEYRCPVVCVRRRFASPMRRAGWGSAFRRCSSCRRASSTICWGAASWAM